MLGQNHVNLTSKFSNRKQQRNGGKAPTGKPFTLSHSSLSKATRMKLTVMEGLHSARRQERRAAQHFDEP